MSAALRLAREHPAIGAAVIARRELRYQAGADPAIDRPAHVRAGSGLAWIEGSARAAGPRLVIAQDDASFLAVLDPRSGAVEPIALEHVIAGARQFDSERGNKKHKLDLEACCTVRRHGREIVLAIGSGSLPVRERIVVFEDRSARIVEATALYARLRAEPDFAGSELNLEGAALAGDRLVLFQRGNGAPREGIAPIDATCELPIDSLLAWLDDPRASAPPRPERITRWDLGAIDGVRLTFTDACAGRGGIAFLAAAEASPNAIDDGEVRGVAIGWIPEEAGAEARWGLVREHGTPFLGKCEGLALAGAGRALAVVDRDDPRAPTELLELATRGIPAV